MSDMRRQMKLTITFFLALPLVLLVVFTYLPMLDMFRYSVLKWDGFGEKTFIGMENYKTLFSSDKYLGLFKVSLYYFAGSLIQIALALFFACAFYWKMKGANYYKGIIFFPSLLNGVAVGFVFLYFFKANGALNAFLVALGANEKTLPLWLGNPAIINYSLVFASV